MFSLHAELRALVVKLDEQRVPYALCGALALAVHGYPRATLDIDLVALEGSGLQIRRCANECGFTLKAAPMTFAAGQVRIERWSKPIPEIDDVLMLDVLTLAPAIEHGLATTLLEWGNLRLSTLTRASLIQLKRLRGSAQDLADIEKLQ